jgi:hypothetical protein
LFSFCRCFFREGNSKVVHYNVFSITPHMIDDNIEKITHPV